MAKAPGLFWGQFRRDAALALRQPGELANPLAFFLLVITLFPLGVSPESAVLATLLSLEGLFRRDRDEGTLEQLVLHGDPLVFAVLARLTVHWLGTGLPLTLLAPLLGAMLALPEAARWPVTLALALGTPILVLLGGVGAALTVSLRAGGVLLALMVLPLFIPVLILGVSVAELAVAGLPTGAVLAWLGAGAALALVTMPFAIAGALSIAVETG